MREFRGARPRSCSILATDDSPMRPMDDQQSVFRIRCLLLTIGKISLTLASFIELLGHLFEIGNWQQLDSHTRWSSAYDFRFRSVYAPRDMARSFSGNRLFGCLQSVDDRAVCK